MADHDPNSGFDDFESLVRHVVESHEWAASPFELLKRWHGQSHIVDIDQVKTDDFQPPKPGQRVRYIGCSEPQVLWGSNVNPDLYLSKDGIYPVVRVEVHTWHTKVWVDGPLGMSGPFNSVCFEVVH